MSMDPLLFFFKLLKLSNYFFKIQLTTFFFNCGFNFCKWIWVFKKYLVL